MSVAPVNQILAAFERLLVAEFPEGLVEVNRVRSLSDEQRELPAFNIVQGSYEPLAGGNTMDSLSAVLNIRVAMFDKGQSSREVISGMVEYHSRMHAALMPVGAMALPFFCEVGWLGANEPVTDAKGTDCAIEIETRWQVSYTFNRDNPNA